MTDFMLTDILAKLDYQQLFNWNYNSYFNSVSFDSRQAKPGHIFVALKGHQHDGHEYIQEALKNGARLVIAEKEPTADFPVSWIKVSDSRLALAQLAAELFQHPSRELMLTGVTGTSGKTTTTSILRHIYETAGLNAGLIGTVNIHCKRKTWPAKMTTPDALEVQRLLRLMVDNGVTHAAMEVSSHSLSQKRVDAIYFRGAIFTNISPNHLDFHREFKEYVKSKLRLASLVATDGFILANVNDPHFCELSDSAITPVFFFGEDSACDVSIGNVALGKYGSIFNLSFNDPRLQDKLPIGKSYFRLRSPLLGRHNISNAAAAAAAALLTGVDEANICKGLASFRGVERRMQVYYFGDLQIIDDTAMNPGSIDAVFNTIKDLSISNLIVVYAIRGCRGINVNEDNGRSLAHWIKTLRVNNFFSTCSNSHVDENNKVHPSEEEAFLKGSLSEGITPKHFMELPETLAQALKAAYPGTTILLLGAQGMDEGLKIFREQLADEEILSPTGKMLH